MFIIVLLRGARESDNWCSFLRVCVSDKQRAAEDHSVNIREASLTLSALESRCFVGLRISPKTWISRGFSLYIFLLISRQCNYIYIDGRGGGTHDERK
jgi:hypothetical protein